MMNTTTATLSADEQAMQNEKPILGHPRGLYICFATELWERFSFYGMKYLLVLYLVRYHAFSDTGGLHVLGSYASLVYALSVLGGLIADRYLGMRKAVILGGILLCFGHLGMAFEGRQAVEYLQGSINPIEITLPTGSMIPAGTAINFPTVMNDISYRPGDVTNTEVKLNHEVIVPANIALPIKGAVQDKNALQVLYFALALIVVGVGFLKPNISTIVGKLYSKDDPRRDSGFTIFYMGINIGSFVATMFCGWLAFYKGWSWGFGAAGIGMVFGLITFLWGQKFLHGHAEPKDPGALKEKVFAGFSREQLIYLGTILAVFGVWQLIQFRPVVEVAFTFLIAGVLIGVIWFMFSRCEKEQKGQMGVLMILMAFTVVFWMLFEQSAASMTLYADRVLDKNVFGFELTAPMIGSLNALFILLTAPVFAWLWGKLTVLNKNPSTPSKFALGIIMAGLGFYVLVIGATFPNSVGKVAFIWMALAYFLHTCGEMCLSPVGLSAVTKLSVPRVVSFMMGTWFLATGIAHLIATEISSRASMVTSGGEITDVSAALATYTELYIELTYIGVGFGALLLIMSPLLKRHMHGVN